MKFSLENDPNMECRGPVDFREFLKRVDGIRNSFAILELKNGNWIQAVNFGDGFIVDKQLGSLSEHFEAIPSGASKGRRLNRSFWQRLVRFKSQIYLTLEDAVACFTAFISESAGPPHIEWQKMKL